MSAPSKEARIRYNKSEKGRAAQARYAKTAKFKATQKRYLSTDKGKETRRVRDRYKYSKNPEKFIGKVMKRYWADPEYHIMKAIARNHGVTSELLQAVFDRDQVCQLCRSQEDLTFDHIHPVSRGGKGTMENLQILCQPCNSFKNDRLFLPGGGMIVSR